MVDRFRIHAEPDAPGMAKMLETVQEGLSDDSLPVVTYNYCIGFEQGWLDCRQQSPRGRSITLRAAFAIHSNQLLLVRHDARFDAGMALGLSNQPAAADLLIGEQFLQP